MKGKAYLPFQSVVLVNAYPGFTFELPSLLFPGPRLLGYGRCHDLLSTRGTLANTKQQTHYVISVTKVKIVC